jgi:hypothetical protein
VRDAKYLLLKNACDNVDFRRTNGMNPKLTGTKYNRVMYINWLKAIAKTNNNNINTATFQTNRTGK